MGASGAYVTGFFAAVFAAVSLALPLHLGGAILALPFLVFAAIAAWAAMTLRLPGTGVARPAHTGRVIVWSTVGEGLGIFVAVNLVFNLGRLDLLIPAIALVVGLHFLPMAFYIPFRPFYATATAMFAAALLGFALPQPAGAAVAGFGSAIVLTLQSLTAIERDRRMKLA